MKRLKIFTWHIHGSYLYYLSHIPHDIYLPRRTDDSLGYCGITPSYPWPTNIHEIPFEEVKNQKFDCVLYQHHDNYLLHQHEVLSSEQLKLPKIFLEHDPPRENPTNTVHPVDDPNTMIVHVTDFNRLMWDCQRSPTTVIDHGVKIPEDVHYEGDLEKGIVIVNNIAKRGRRLGLDIFQKASLELDLDLVGMGWEDVGGIGEVSHQELPAFCSHYRYFFNPIRYTSLGLSICEAMMIGVPIIGLATTELATVVENNVSGFISTRPEELTIAARELVKNKKLADEWGKKAKKRAQERFGIERFIRDWNNTLQEVVRS
ncbi:glycosyltransferase [Peredibacter sp. HCB2-198]|uniref:glycosyltransferase n=1 Tax=Peredibacter sp. HCB2-198 TaxID=3383025 RepID=UPI0038B5C3B6